MSNNRQVSIGSHTQLYIVIKSFDSRLPDELTINEGDLIDLISDDSEFDDGWYMGKNLTTNKIGLYPKVFTQIYKNDNELISKPSLLRSRSRRTTNQNSPITPTAAPSSYFNDISYSSNDTNNTSTVNRYVNDIDKALEELNIDNNNNNNNENTNNNPLNPINAPNWTPDQVSQYFKQFVDDDIAENFKTHKISGSILLELELAYLKELDITSFGTRFEIYKKIEELRSIVENKNNTYNNNNQSGIYSTIDSPSSSSNLSRNNTFSNKINNRFNNSNNQRPQSVIIDHSKILKNTPSPLQFNSSTDSHINMPNDYSIDKVSNDEPNSTPRRKSKNTLDLPNNDSEQFVSPRRAPQPPSYPSPVANNPQKFGIRSPTKLTNSIPRLSNIQSHSRNSSMGNTSSIYVDTMSPSYSRRHSSIISDNSNLEIFNNNYDKNDDYNNNNNNSKSHRRYSSIIINKPFGTNTPSPERDVMTKLPELNHNNNSSNSSVQRRSLSAKDYTQMMKQKDVTKRLTSDITGITSSKTPIQPQVNTMNQESLITPPPLQSKQSTFKSMVTGNRNGKSQTSAFQEGIRSITPDEAIKDAEISGWMFKRGNLSIGSWKQRFFTLHKTRLSYYVTTKDTKEKGLIDITSHRVLPATEAEDKLSAVYAASAGYGRFCFKLIPPAPGSRKGLTFTQQKVHYFAVETREEMRNWMSALMKATIELDDSIPAISSCSTPTIPLQKAQELLAVARENARENFDNLQKSRAMGNNNIGDDDPIELINDNIDSSIDDEFLQTSRINDNNTPSSTNSNFNKNRLSINTSSQHNGMSMPYILTAGLSSSNISEDNSSGGGNNNNNNNNNVTTPTRMSSIRNPQHIPPIVTKLDGNDEDGGALDTFEAPPSALQSSNSFSRRFKSLRRVSKDKD